MNYWYRPNVLKRKWGSYGSITNEYFNNYINDDFDPDNGEDYYFKEDDVDLHPDDYENGTFYEPDIEIYKTDIPIPEDVDINMKMNQLDTFSDPDINEYKNENLINIETDDNMDIYEKENVQEEMPIYEIINPEDPTDVLTYTNPITQILQKAGIDTSNEAEMAKYLLEIRDIIRENNRKNIDELIKAQEQGLIINGSIIKDKKIIPKENII
ncbi:hypothetical protein EHI7A_155400 [Entamoeba histolytica HM-1:IMSS-A]|uniref:Uncharacterized protein n=1 Tax=Entamoeba histolytica HM-1:IMSS-A TaxID=885318 RepID=N9V5R4_ENTH1|nr:hypothetical protein EHI7A_155400 [Entamoeba histolytica HM-1:IMSS-A]